METLDGSLGGLDDSCASGSAAACARAASGRGECASGGGEGTLGGGDGTLGTEGAGAAAGAAAGRAASSSVASRVGGLLLLLPALDAAAAPFLISFLSYSRSAFHAASATSTGVGGNSPGFSLRTAFSALPCMLPEAVRI